MRLRRLWVLFALCASACGGVVLVACKGGPKVSICILDAKSGGLQCSDPDQKTFFLTWEEADNYVAVSPKDMERIMRACREPEPK